jgi:CHAT domain-containing protein
VPNKTVSAAIIGSTLIALLLAGSLRNAASSPLYSNTPEAAEIKRLAMAAEALYRGGHYLEARDAFRAIASRAEKAHLDRAAAMNWNNAGGCSLVAMRFKAAYDDFTKARADAENTHQYVPLAYALNSTASLYIHTGEPENAVRVAREALEGPAGNADPLMRAKLLYQVALADLMLNRFEEARPYYQEAIEGFVNQKDLDSAARAWGGIGAEFLRTGRLEQAETALSEGLRLVRIHRLDASASILSGLGRLKSAQGDARSAAALFDAALAAPAGITPRFMIYAYRGRFRLNTGNLPGALADFRESRKLVTSMRAEIVPADQDRVALEQGLSLVYEGMVDAGNRLALQTGDRSVLRETFDTAEQDRLWSLRALIPSPNDWRTKLPERYWELLATYQALERSAVAAPSKEMESKTGALRLQLKEFEAAAAGATGGERERSPLAYIRGILNDDTVLLSFHTTETSSWLWAVDRSGVDVYPLPGRAELQSQVETFSRELRSGAPAVQNSAKLYRNLFGAVRGSYLKHRRWLLELDGPLYELPFAALVTEQSQSGPAYLVERADLQSLPNALLAERGEVPANGEFLGVGDPIYNPADSRYQGARTSSNLLLPRLPNTSREVQACARAWNSTNPQLLTGQDARMESVRAAMETNPSIIHFATHVVTEPGAFRSGLIALSLNPKGEMGLLGPKDIVARPVTARLVVMDGCHSAQGESLPSAGLMGLTRAWIGAGAMSVVATQWDVPDDAAQSLMIDFYRCLRASPKSGVAGALREAQIAALHRPEGRRRPSSWAGYFLLSRLI